MAYRQRRSYGRYGYAHHRTAGQAAAIKHIEEARSFEREIGGSVKDVKKYFFELDRPSLNKLFFAYGKQYGSSVESYARATFPKWKSGTTEMSGLVAKRLFDFLPPMMPPAVKLQLAENVWRHFGTRSSHYFTVGPAADATAVMDAIQAKFDEYIVDHNIPQNVKNRFNWLSAGDVQVKEALLNHFRQLDRKIAATSLREQLPVLQQQMHNYAGHTTSIKTSIVIHNHSFEIAVDKGLGNSFREGRPQRVNPLGSNPTAIWLIVAAAVIFMFFLLSGHR